MDSSTPSSRRTVLAESYERCVWMSAGVLSYQLCERGLECDHCPLDQALRARFGRPEAGLSQGTERAPQQAGPRLSGDRLYSPGHAWVKPMRRSADGNRTVACVGLEPGLASALVNPKTVVLPTVGDRLQRGRHHAWIVMDGGTLPIEVPLDGAVTAIHHELSEEPGLLARSPLGDGWLLEMEVTEAQMKAGRLMPRADAERRYALEGVRFRALISRALGGSDEAPAGGAEAAGGAPGSTSRSRVGPTLPDGGVPLQAISEMLGPARYFALLMQAFG